MSFCGITITETDHFPPPRNPLCWVYVTVNAEVALQLPDIPALQSLLNTGRSRVSVDGQWVWWALRRRHPQRPLKKMAGSDMIHSLAQHCAETNQRLLLLGSSPQANAGAVQRLTERWPQLHVAGFAPGVFEVGQPSEAEVFSQCLAGVRAHRPDYVVLGLTPGKIYALAHRMAKLLDGSTTGMLCFGGAIDMAGGSVKRAPLWSQRYGLEGLYRLWQQPSRLPRFLRVLPIIPRVLFNRF